LDEDFLALLQTDNFCGDFGTRDVGMTEFQTGVGSNGQNSIELDAIAGFGGFSVVDVYEQAFGNFVLSSTVTDNCVHGNPSRSKKRNSSKGARRGQEFQGPEV
jgi:hypothetical protein